MIAVVGQRCLVCEEPVHSEEGTLACSACGFVLHAEAGGILAAPGEIGVAEYPDWGNDLTLEVEDGSFWFQHRNRALMALFGRHPFEGRLWDVGGGNGYQALMLERAGRQVAMVEPGPAGCRNAGQRGVSTVIRATLEGLRIPDGRLSAISLLDVIEHLAQPDALLAEAHRVIRPGGRLYVTVPALSFLWSHEDVMAEHKRRYTCRSLGSALATAGFRTPYITYYFRPLLWPVFLFRTVPHRACFWRRVESGMTMDQGDHRPSGLARRVIEALLAREVSAIEAGRALRSGTSVMAAATRL